MSEYKTIEVITDERGVMTLTLNRTDKHNALDAVMIEELTQIAQKVEADTQIRAVILAAHGKTWCAGGDLNWMKSQFEKDRQGREKESQKLSHMLHSLNTLRVPLIGRVHGPAYGGGVGLMSVCDIVVAIEGLKFGLTETKLGLIPATIGPFVIRKMGEGFSRKVFFTSKSFDVNFALKSALVSEVCKENELDDLIASHIEAILTCAPGAITDAKKLCQTLGGIPLESYMEETTKLLADRWESEEAQEGIRSFMERRDPNFKVSNSDD